MKESVCGFLFRKLGHEKYLTIEVMMYVEYQKVCNFIFNVNKTSRNFLKVNAKAIKNECINNGLISYKFKCNFQDYEMLERLYF